MQRFISKPLAGVLILGVVLVLSYYYKEFLTLKELQRYQETIEALVASKPFTSAFIYVLIMITIIALTIPGSTVLSLSGGFLFQQPYASILAYISYVLGALFSYFFVSFFFRGFFQDKLRSNKSVLFKKLANNLKTNAFCYLILARFTLVFPFWFVNGASAALGVNFKTFILATSISSVPGAIIYTQIGSRLIELLSKQNPDEPANWWPLLLETFLIPEIQLVCVCAVLISVLPYVYNRLYAEDTKS